MFSSNLTFHQNYNFVKKNWRNVSGVVYVILKSVWVGCSFFFFIGWGGGVMKICRYLMVISNCALNKLRKKTGGGGAEELNCKKALHE